MLVNFEREERKEREYTCGLMEVIEKGYGNPIILRFGKLNKFIHNKHKMKSNNNKLLIIENSFTIFKKEEILIQHIPFNIIYYNLQKKYFFNLGYRGILKLI